MSTSPWFAKPFVAVSSPSPCTSGSQSPVPSSLSRATYSVPLSSRLKFAPRSELLIRPDATNL